MTSKTPTKTRKKAKKQPADRVVFEVKTERGTTQVEASSVTELKKALLPLLGLDNYGTQATAHLALNEKATVQAKTWSVRRVGVLAFVADTDEAATERRPATPAVPSTSASQTPTDQQPAPKPAKKEAAVQAPQATTEQPEPGQFVTGEAASQPATEQQNAVYGASASIPQPSGAEEIVEETPRNPHGG